MVNPGAPPMYIPETLIYLVLLKGTIINIKEYELMESCNAWADIH